MKTNEKHEKLLKHETNWKKWKNEKAWQEMISNGKKIWNEKKWNNGHNWQEMSRVKKQYQSWMKTTENKLHTHNERQTCDVLDAAIVQTWIG